MSRYANYGNLNVVVSFLFLGLPLALAAAEPGRSRPRLNGLKPGMQIMQSQPTEVVGDKWRVFAGPVISGRFLNQSGIPVSDTETPAGLFLPYRPKNISPKYQVLPEDDFPVPPAGPKDKRNHWNVIDPKDKDPRDAFLSNQKTYSGTEYPMVKIDDEGVIPAGGDENTQGENVIFFATTAPIPRYQSGTWGYTVYFGLVRREMYEGNAILMWIAGYYRESPFIPYAGENPEQWAEREMELNEARAERAFEIWSDRDYAYSVHELRIDTARKKAREELESERKADELRFYRLNLNRHSHDNDRSKGRLPSTSPPAAGSQPVDHLLAGDPRQTSRAAAPSTMSDAETLQEEARSMILSYEASKYWAEKEVDKRRAVEQEAASELREAGIQYKRQQKTYYSERLEWVEGFWGIETVRVGRTTTVDTDPEAVRRFWRAQDAYQSSLSFRKYEEENVKGIQDKIDVVKKAAATGNRAKLEELGKTMVKWKF